MVKAWIEDAIDYKIPDNLKGKKIPDTEILIPKNAYGLLVESDLFSARDTPGAIIIFYEKEEILYTEEYQESEDELRKKIENYLKQNKN